MNNRRGYPTIIQAAYLSIGLCVTNFIYLYFGLPLQGGVRTLGVLAILCVLTVLLARILIIRVFRPRLTGLPRQEQLAIISVAGIVGLILLLSNPLGIPQHRLYGFLPEVIQAVLNVITLAITGGMLILIILLGVIGTRRPIYPRFPLVAGFFIAYLLIGLAVYDDYGISVDEPTQRQHALISLKYVLSQFDPAFAEVRFPEVEDLETYAHRYYGVAFHLPLIITEELLTSIPDSQSLWLFRHYVTFLFFYAGTLAFYRLASEKYDWRFGLLGTILLVTTPRIFAESIYNVKDTTFLSAFTIALYFGFRFWRHKTITSGLLFGLAAAFATNVRVIAVFLLVLGVGMTAIEYLQAPKRQKILLSIFTALFTFGIVLIVTAPVSWANPLAYLGEVLQRFTSYQPWNGYIMYLGEFIRGQRAPWHYLPIWMLITIPATVLVLFGIGALATFIQSIKLHLRLIWQTQDREDVAFLLLAILPVLAAIVLESTVYSGWRHFTFIYAPMTMIALKGVHLLLKRAAVVPGTARLQRIIIISFFAWVSLYQLNIVRWMAVNHPYQNVYFNDTSVRLLGGRENFELDYWRLSVRQGIEYLLNIDPNAQINIYTHPRQGDAPKNAMILSSADISRITTLTGNSVSSGYIIDTYRFPFRYFNLEKAMHSITVDGQPILSLYRYEDLYEEIFDEDPIEGRRLILNTSPFFTTEFADGQNSLSNPEGVNEFVTQRVILAFPFEAAQWIGSEVTFAVRYDGEMTIDGVQRIGCNGQELETFRITSEQIEFDLSVDREKSGNFLCRLIFVEPQTLYGAVVTAADALPQDD